MARLVQMAVHPVQSLTTRKYLLAAVVGWVLVVYLAAAPSSSPAPPSSVRPAVGPARVAAPAPAPVTSAAAPFATFSVPTSPTFAFPSIDFGAPPPAPPATAPLDCPYPIPQSQTSPFSAGIFLNFEGPLIDLSGPFAIYDIPTLGAIAPLVPLVTPLVYIAEPVMNALTPNISNAVTDYLTIIDDAGLNSPQEQQYAAEFEPYYLKLLDSLAPAETALASSTAGQCLVLFENELAVMDSQQSITLPNPPIIVPTFSGSSTDGASSAVETAATADSSSSFAQLVLPWFGGLPASLAATEAALQAKGHPVELELVDAPPAGQPMGGTGFADFVAEAVHASPQVSAFQIDAPGTDPAGTAQVADLVHGLAAADMERLPGQLIGVGVPEAATGAGAGSFWSAFDQSMKGWQPNMVDFVAADLTPAAEPSPAAAQAEALSSVRALEAAFTSLGGVPADVPVFGTVSLAGSGPWTEASVQEQIAGYLAALRGQQVRFLGVDTAG
jgi:hypothetical protein